MFGNFKDSLIEAAEIILEMSYHRKRAMELIPPQASELARKIILCHHSINSPDLPHWKSTTDGHIANIHELTFLKGKKRLKENDIREAIWEEPMGEYSDYLRKHQRVCKDKPETQMSPPSTADYQSIKSKYSKMIKSIVDGNTIPEYESL